MTRKSALGILAMSVIALSASANAATTLKVTTCLARNHDYTLAFLETFVNPINAKHGAVTLNYLGGPEVTPDKEQATALKRGLIDIIMCPAAYYSGLFGQARIPGAQNVPIDEIRKNGAWDMMEQAWEKNLNAHILSWVFDKGQKFYTYYTVKPKESTKTGLDLTGMKIRSTGLYNPFLIAMGATTVTTSAGDVYAGLERGVVSGLAWPWGSIAKYGWERFLKYRVRPSFFSGSELIVINLDKWKSLSKEQQALLNDQVPVLEHKGAEAIIKLGEQDDAKLKKAGVKDIVLQGAVRKAYLNTIYEAKWAQTDKVNHEANYKKLKSLVYKPVK